MNNDPTKKSTLVVIRGIPGSGKSYLAAALQKAAGLGGVVVIDPDKVDQTTKEFKNFSVALTSEGVEIKFHTYRFLRAKAYQAIEEGKTIIWNQAFTDFEGFKVTAEKLGLHAKEKGIKLRVLVIEVEVEPAVARARTRKRFKQGGHGVPDEAFTNFVNNYKSFAGKGYPAITINGAQDVAKSVLAVIKKLG